MIQSWSASAEVDQLRARIGHEAELGDDELRRQGVPSSTLQEFAG
jgi:hypothetical protein